MLEMKMTFVQEITSHPEFEIICRFCKCTAWIPDEGTTWTITADRPGAFYMLGQMIALFIMQPKSETKTFELSVQPAGNRYENGFEVKLKIGVQSFFFCVREDSDQAHWYMQQIRTALDSLIKTKGEC